MKRIKRLAVLVDGKEFVFEDGDARGLHKNIDYAFDKGAIMTIPVQLRDGEFVSFRTDKISTMTWSREQ